MNIRLSREVINNAVLSTVEILDLSEREREALVRYGSPMIEVGGTISGNYTRTTARPPIPVITGGGTGAELFIEIDEESGAVEEVIVTSQGTGYTNPTILLTNTESGSGATFSITTNVDGAITAVTVLTGGTGYIPESYTIVYTLPSSMKRLDKSFVTRMKFNYELSRNADLQADAYTATIENRIKLELTKLLSYTSEYIGETEKTL